MNTTFIKPAEVLPRWMALAPGCLFQSADERLDSANARAGGLPVADLCDGRTGDNGGISQKGGFFPSHAGQSGFEGFKVHEINPYMVSLSENGLHGNLKSDHIRLKNVDTIYGMKSTPSRNVLAQNLNRLMASTYALDSNTKMARHAKLGLGTIGRVRNAEVDATVDTLDKLAEAFDVQPWQLLAPPGIIQPPQAELPLIAAQPITPLLDTVQPSGRGLELGLLFDLLTGRDGKIDQAEVFTAAVEAISRTVTGRHAKPTGTPEAPDRAKKRVA
jgi:transcriptional regulator with XRE-family HTH domain